MITLDDENKWNKKWSYFHSSAEFEWWIIPSQFIDASASQQDRGDVWPQWWSCWAAAWPWTSWLSGGFFCPSRAPPGPPSDSGGTNWDKEADRERARQVSNARLQTMLRSLSMSATDMMCIVKNMRDGCRGVSPGLRSCRFLRCHLESDLHANTAKDSKVPASYKSKIKKTVNVMAWSFFPETGSPVSATLCLE